MKVTLYGYKEWLLDIMIRCGVGVITNSELPWNYLQKASELGHIAYMDNDEFQTLAYVLTPTAANYLKENE
jgi:hypothetical protein